MDVVIHSPEVDPGSSDGGGDVASTRATPSRKGVLGYVKGGLASSFGRLRNIGGSETLEGGRESIGVDR